jgi:hypothetical protein
MVTMTLLECITSATREGYRAHYVEGEGWYITTPKAHRRPSQELGPYTRERTAWFDAALLAQSAETA